MESVKNNQEEEIAKLKEDLAKAREEIEVLREAHDLLIKELKEKDEKNSTDSLTGLLRREYFRQEISDYLGIMEGSVLEAEEKRTSFEVPKISLIIFDIDHFKTVNDTYGHPTGDLVLKKVAETIKDYSRRGDISCRWGGEEMMLAMIGADEMAAATKANFIRSKIEKLVFEEVPDLKISVSAGVSSSEDFKEFDNLYDAADKSLYYSKANGRNKVTTNSEIRNVEK